MTLPSSFTTRTDSTGQEKSADSSVGVEQAEKVRRPAKMNNRFFCIRTIFSYLLIIL